MKKSNSNENTMSPIRLLTFHANRHKNPNITKFQDTNKKDDLNVSPENLKKRCEYWCNCSVCKRLEEAKYFMKNYTFSIVKKLVK